MASVYLSVNTCHRPGQIQTVVAHGAGEPKCRDRGGWRAISQKNVFSSTQMAGSWPNLHTMVLRLACIRACSSLTVKVKVWGIYVTSQKCLYHKTFDLSLGIQALLWCHVNRFSQANGHMIVPRRAYIQGVLKFKVEMKGHMIPAHFEFHKESLTQSFPNLNFSACLARVGA